MEHHNHSHSIKSTKEKRALGIVLGLTFCFMIVETVAGFYTGSLALLSDAGHMLTDVFALSLALFALWFSQKASTSTKTFGFYRAEILAAFFNSLLLFAHTARSKECRNDYRCRYRAVRKPSRRLYSI
jgi:cobalt-zinc-cadmium efflux system protein